MNTLVRTLSGMQSDATPESRRFVVHGWFVTAVMHGFPPVLGLVLLVLAQQGVATTIPALPIPAVTWKTVIALFTDPFYRNGPNDQSVGWNVSASLARASTGFSMTAVISIPAGFLIGRFTFLNTMASPIVSLLRPVSPLAWLPVGLLLFKSTSPATIWAIFIYSARPMMINTTVDVTRVPQDYLDVARVLNLSEWKVLTHVLFPAVLPYTLTGVRLSIGTV